ncbi:hypothetical protein EG328_004545 [Venturia inaequalis]|uniref:Transmembrane protein n=1 Tax=Venturia inaequalis TaxID=5025 RepID=A0A8H3VFJ2_VENIN|nr:hypothetical protein EG328_004545 [Venturia inaequalis]KAE9994648.1 hypothetical protein EG327_006791 [Venturia inaequalis]
MCVYDGTCEDDCMREDNHKWRRLVLVGHLFKILYCLALFIISIGVYVWATKVEMCQQPFPAELTQQPLASATSSRSWNNNVAQPFGSSSPSISAEFHPRINPRTLQEQAEVPSSTATAFAV